MGSAQKRRCEGADARRRSSSTVKRETQDHSMTSQTWAQRKQGVRVRVCESVWENERLPSHDPPRRR